MQGSFALDNAGLRANVHGGAALCLVAAGLAATAVHYLAEIDPAQLPEGPGLCRGARVMAWLPVEDEDLTQ